MKKYHIWLLAILLIVLVAGGVFLQKDKNNMVTQNEEEREKVDVVEVVEVDGAKVLTYDEDVIYVPDYHYEDLRDTFRTALEEQWEQEKLDEKELGPYAYVPGTLPSNYGYMYKDLNGDGIDEMIVGYDDADMPLITEIYTIVDEVPFKVFTSGIRHRADIYSDGTIVESAITNPGRGEELYEVYTLTPNGTKNIKSGYTYDATDEVYKSLLNPNKELSRDEVEKLWDKYKNPIELSFTPFVSDETDEEIVKD